MQKMRLFQANLLRILTQLLLRMRHAAELRGRELVAPLEGDAELARAVVADGGGDFDDGKPGFAQQLGGAAHHVLDVGESVEQRVFRMVVQMDKCHRQPLR